MRDRIKFSNNENLSLDTTQAIDNLSMVADNCQFSAGVRKSNRKRKKSNLYLEQLKALPKISKIKYRFNAVSLFCGGGGLDLGAAWAGFKVIFASDVESVHCDTIKYNFPDCSVLSTDIEDLTRKKIIDKTGIEEIDLLVGGPPCQAFSILGKRESIKDPRGKLIYEYARLIDELKPRAFIFENVPGLLTVNNGDDWNDFLNYLKSSKTKYKLSTAPLNAADFGVPQIRNRIFIVGFKDENARFNFPPPTHHNEEKQDILTEDLSVVKNFWIPAKYALENIHGKKNHRIRVHGKTVKHRYKNVTPGARDKVDHTTRIHPEKPAGTVLVGSKDGGGRPHIHPEKPRHITVREAARLQSFPDWYIFQGAETWQYRAVGNAVPPLLGRSICLEIASTLEKLDKTKNK
jgi:DNA (cytosine-5)-methyltransferase 1